MGEPWILGVALIGAGTFSILGAALEWSFFMNHKKAQLIAKVFGRQGTRIFYVVLGLFVAGIGAGISFGLLPVGPGR